MDDKTNKTNETNETNETNKSYTLAERAKNEKSIYLVEKAGRITEVNGKRKFYLQFDDSQILKYEKMMLSGSSCPYTLPMKFLSHDGITKVWYDFTGYIQLKEYIKTEYCNTIKLNDLEPTYEAIDIILKILQNLKEIEDYLILPYRISVNSDTVFINPSDVSILLAFYPNEAPELTLQKRIFNMLSKISSWYQNDEVVQYISRFQNTVYEKNLGLEGMISVLYAMKRELSYIYCNKSHLRKSIEITDTNTGITGIEDAKKDYKFEKCRHFGLGNKIKGSFLNILVKSIHVNRKHK